MAQLTTMTDDALEQLRRDVVSEQERRQETAALERQQQALRQDALAGLDRTDWADWVRPANPITAYPRAAKVTHDDRRWIATADGTLTEPGVSGWREYPEDGPGDYRQPSTAADAYQLGERVLFKGQVWEAVAAGGSIWSPADAPDAWQKIDTDA